MLKKRVIPTLLWKNLGLVKGISFDSWRRIGTLMPAIKVYNTRDVDELIVMDIAATVEGSEPEYDVISDFSCECFVPLTIGGGVDSLEKIRKLLLSGADKVAINSAVYLHPDLISKAAMRFGSQCIVVSIDARKLASGEYECYSHCGSKPTGKRPADWAQEVERLGAGEILITSVELDGSMKGYDVELIHNVSENVKVPVIASGGAGEYKDFYEAIEIGKASAVAAASMFHFTEKTPAGAKAFLADQGVAVRDVKATAS